MRGNEKRGYKLDGVPILAILIPMRGNEQTEMRLKVIAMLDTNPHEG